MKIVSIKKIEVLKNLMRKVVKERSKERISLVENGLSKLGLFVKHVYQCKNTNILHTITVF